jgi:hypothetical protein
MSPRWGLPDDFDVLFPALTGWATDMPPLSGLGRTQLQAALEEGKSKKAQGGSEDKL